MDKLAWAVALTLSITGPALANTPEAHWITLGTAGGPIASPTRSQPSNLLVTPTGTYLVDCGDGCVEQLAKAHVPLWDVKGLFISHLHYDHVGGISALLGLRYQINDVTPLPIYGPPGTKAMIDGLITAMQPFARSSYGIPGTPYVDPATTVKVTELWGGDHIVLDDIAASTVQNTHYSFPPGSEEDKRFRSLSWRFEVAGRSFVFTGDTGPSDAVTRFAKGADVLISEVIDLDATLALVHRAHNQFDAATEQRMVLHLSSQHLRAPEVGRMAETAGVKEVVVTHYAPSTPTPELVEHMRQQITAQFNGIIAMSKDLDIF